MKKKIILIISIITILVIILGGTALYVLNSKGIFTGNRINKDGKVDDWKFSSKDVENDSNKRNFFRNF